MRLPVGCPLLVLAALVLLAAITLAPEAEAKGKKASCKGGKVAIRAGKRTTCAPFAKVFPKPREVDLRLSYLQQALKLDPAKLAGRKGKRIPHAGRRLR